MTGKQIVQGSQKVTGFAATHDGICCRCFLPDLTGFTSLRCTGPGHVKTILLARLLMDKSTGINQILKGAAESSLFNLLHNGLL